MVYTETLETLLAETSVVVSSRSVPAQVVRSGYINPSAFLSYTSYLGHDVLERRHRQVFQYMLCFHISKPVVFER